METAVIVLKAKSDKQGIRTLAYQVAQMSTVATKQNLKIVDCIVTFGGVRDVLREVRALDGRKRVDAILLYSPAQVAKTEQEFLDLVETLREDFQMMVHCVRSKN